MASAHLGQTVLVPSQCTSSLSVCRSNVEWLELVYVSGSESGAHVSPRKLLQRTYY